MTKQEVIDALRKLSDTERQEIFSEFVDQTIRAEINLSRREYLNNKRGNCPHCESRRYIKFGVYNDIQRYRCKTCKRTFTEYTGTFISGLHHKDLVEDYLKLMEQELSLDKIVAKLKINKKTALDWRHKILSALEANASKKDFFVGITESDEMFLPFSEKGSKNLKRKPRKRGGGLKKGITDDKVAVIVTTDRGQTQNFTVACRGRICKKDIQKAIGEMISDKTILCTDSHVTYKGFAIDMKIEHHALRSDLKERVIRGIYHIQHVNSLHSHIKRWISNSFIGVSTKYLQGYLNWFMTKERLKDSKNYLKEFTRISLQNNSAKEIFENIPKKFELLNKTT